MTSMIYIDPDFGPSARELFAAANVADGWPGQFLAALRAEPFEAVTQPSVTLVHESSVPYRPETSATIDRNPRRPYDNTAPVSPPLVRAASRAASLARRGRHSAAVRLLIRAIRLLEARGAAPAAADCALQLAWIARSRGDTGDAHSQISRARALSDSAVVQANAAALSGVVWTDEGLFVEAETALRSAHAAAAAIGSHEVAGRAALGLARALLWQERLPEALATLEELSGQHSAELSCEALALGSRIHAAGGDVASALGAASQALLRATGLHNCRLQASAHRAMAISLLLARDVTGAELHIPVGTAGGLGRASSTHGAATARAAVEHPAYGGS